jgi:hypothetical protein
VDHVVLDRRDFYHLSLWTLEGKNLSAQEEVEEQDVQEVQEEPRPTPAPTEKKGRRFNIETFRQIAEALKWIQRAILGQELEEDKLQGMMNQKDIRERTRISVKGIRRHVYQRVVSKQGELRAGLGGLNPYKILEEVADQEDTYLIAKDGEQRKEYILLKRTEPQQSNVSIGVIPSVETKLNQQKKEHFWSRNKNPAPQNN